MSAILEFQKAAIAALQGNVVLMASVNGVFDNVPQNIAPPYIFFGDVSSGEVGSLASKAQDIRLDIFCVSESLGKKEVYEISEKIAEILDGQILALAGDYEHFSTRLLSSEVRQENDAKTNISQQVFEVRVGLT